MPEQKIEISHAILSINPNADFTYSTNGSDDEIIASIDWKTTTPISAEDIKVKKAELEAE